MVDVLEPTTVLPHTLLAQFQLHQMGKRSECCPVSNGIYDYLEGLSYQPSIPTSRLRYRACLNTAWPSPQRSLPTLPTTDHFGSRHEWLATQSTLQPKVHGSRCDPSFPKSPPCPSSASPVTHIQSCLPHGQAKRTMIYIHDSLEPLWACGGESRGDFVPYPRVTRSMVKIARFMQTPTAVFLSK